MGSGSFDVGFFEHFLRDQIFDAIESVELVEVEVKIEVKIEAVGGSVDDLGRLESRWQLARRWRSGTRSLRRFFVSDFSDFSGPTLFPFFRRVSDLCDSVYRRWFRDPNRRAE